MPEPPAAAPAGVAASEQDVLLATKLHVPGPRPGFVARPRLAGALAGGLVLVCAPAGFGKTALLADWLRSGGRPVAWLSLDAGDNDPVRFWRHVVAALDRARPGTGERVAPLLGPPRSSFEGLVTALINELAAQSGENAIVLVLDDYHLINARQVHASLAFLLEHRPPGTPPEATQPIRSAAAAGPAAGPRAAGGAARGRPAVHRRGGGGPAARIGWGRPARRRRGGARGPHRRLGGRPAAGRPVAAGTVRHCRVRGGLQWQPPLHPGLSDWRSA